MRRDVESSRPAAGAGGSNNPHNPYADLPPPRPRWHPLAFLPRGLWISGSLYMMHQMDVYENIMKSPEISHEWFKVGLACSVALLFLKAYVELYTGILQKQTVSYKTMPQSTHASIVLLMLSGIAFHVALWPVYGGRSIFIMFLVSAFLINFCLMFPTIVQNLVALVVLTFFLQEYK